jgi:hypothetical protein
MRSYPIRADVLAAQLSRRDRMSAWYQGWHDGRRQLTVPVLADQPGGPDEAWTPFIGEARDVARAASNQLIAWLLDQNQNLIRKIYKQADTVVREHDVEHDLTDGTRGRFVSSVSTWRAAATATRARAEAAVDHANQLIHCYWRAFLRSGPKQQPPPPGWQPGLAVADPVWAKADLLLLLTYGDQVDDEATAHAGHVLRRALQIIADTGRPPGRPNPTGDER